MYAVKQVVAHDLAGNRLRFIIQQHHVIAVPTHWTADMQQQARHVQHGGGDFVGNHFGRMEVTRIQTQRRLATGGVTHVELVRAHGVAFRTDAKQLAFDGIDMVRRVEFLADHFVQRVQQTLARR